MSVRLVEQSKPQAGSVFAQKALIKIISEGIGSSGIYPGEVLREFGPAAFPAGTKIFMDHLTEQEDWDRNGNHSAWNVIGVATSDAAYDEESKALVADALFFSNVSSFLAEAWTYMGLSIEAMGLVNDQGVVYELLPHPLNAIAMVPEAGRGGQIIGLVESYKDSGILGTATTQPEGKKMTPEEISAVASAVAETLKPAFDALAPAAQEPEGESAEIEVAGVTEAMISADLPAPARTRVYEGLTAGGTLDDLIAKERTYIASLRESADPASPGVVHSPTQGAPAQTKILVEGWK